MNAISSTIFNAGFPIYWWRGKSDRMYPHSVFPLSSVPCLLEANYVVATQSPDGTYSPMYIGATENLMETLRTHPAILQALGAGATHIHIHLLAETPRQRLEIRQDLRDGCRVALPRGQALRVAS